MVFGPRQPSPRPIPPNLGVAKLKGASAFTNRFFSQEWVIMVQRKARKHLIHVNDPNSEVPKYQFDKCFKTMAFRALLRLARAAVGLLNDQPCFVEIGSGISFDQHVMGRRALHIGGFPSRFPNINEELPEHNPLEGTFTKKEALSRAKELQSTGTQLIHFLNRAYNLKGQRDDNNDPWDFQEILVPASDQSVNATYPDTIQTVTQEEWRLLNHLAHTSNELTANETNQGMIHVPTPNVTDLNLVNPALLIANANAHANTSPIANVNDILSSANNHYDGNNPVNSVEVPPGLTVPSSSPVSPPYDPYADSLDYVYEASVPSAHMDMSGINNEDLDRALEDLFVNSVTDQSSNDSNQLITATSSSAIANVNPSDQFPTFTASSYLVRSEYTPYLNEQPYSKKCPCGMRDLLLRAYSFGRKDEYDELKERFEAQSEGNVSVKEEVITPPLFDDPTVDSGHGELISHPIYGKEACNALIKYSPYPSRLLSRV
jgi:hypothetical protein